MKKILDCVGTLGGKGSIKEDKGIKSEKGAAVSPDLGRRWKTSADERVLKA